MTKGACLSAIHVCHSVIIFVGFLAFQIQSVLRGPTRSMVEAEFRVIDERPNHLPEPFVGPVLALFEILAE